MVIKGSGWQRISFSRMLAGIGLACTLTAVSTSSLALFGNFMPLSLSGSVSYNYSYYTAGEAETETTNLTGSLNASGFIWQPWFATTSAALNLGLSNTETSISSSDSTISSGSFGLYVFPRSRFPFSLNYSHSDSRFDTYSEVNQIAGGDTHYTVSRLTLRQIYEGRATKRSIGSRASFWYTTTDFESELTQSDSETMGLEYKIRLVPHSFLVSVNHASNTNSNSSLKPKSDVVNVTHSYTPSGDLGVTNLATYVKTDTGTADSENTLTQASSNFFWRPEHRAVNVSGGVRAAKTESSSASGATAEQKSLNTNLGVSYRLTRRLSLGGSVSLGSSESGETQSLSTSQNGNLNYSSRQMQLGGFSYNWQSGLNASNSATRTDTGTTESSRTIQSTSMQLGHSLSRRWVPGNQSSIGLSLGQSGSVHSSSDVEEPVVGVSHSAGLSMSRRGRSGSIYGNIRVSDSRTSGTQDTEFQNLDASISQDININRLSNLSGSVTYSASTQKTISDQPGISTSSENRVANANVNYRHDRPFGIYSLTYNSRFQATKEFDTYFGGMIWNWDNRFRYRLGLLDTSLSFRIIGREGGDPSKSLNFQATRTF